MSKCGIILKLKQKVKISIATVDIEGLKNRDLQCTHYLLIKTAVYTLLGKHKHLYPQLISANSKSKYGA